MGASRGRRDSVSGDGTRRPNSLSSSHPSASTSQVASTKGAVKVGNPSDGKFSTRGTEIRIPSSGGISDRRQRNKAIAARIAL